MVPLFVNILYVYKLICYQGESSIANLIFYVKINPLCEGEIKRHFIIHKTNKYEN